jgi:hypothetical protein
MSQNGSTAARGGVLLLLVLAVAIVPALAADTWPNCAFKCTAGDVTLVSIYAVVAGGACESGGTTMAQIYGRFTASAQRYAVILIGDLHVEGGTTQRLEQCAGDLPAGTTDVLLTTVAWPCGRAITLGNINVSWSTNGRRARTQRALRAPLSARRPRTSPSRRRSSSTSRPTRLDV